MSIEIEYLEDWNLCTGHYAWDFPFYYRNGKKYHELAYENGMCKKENMEKHAKTMDDNYEASKKAITKRIHDHITHPYQKNHGVLMLTLIHSQHSAIDALLEMGAEQSDWIVKHQHSDSKIAVFWIDIYKYNLKLGNVADHEETYPSYYKEGTLHFYEG